MGSHRRVMRGRQAALAAIVLLGVAAGWWLSARTPAPAPLRPAGPPGLPAPPAADVPRLRAAAPPGPTRSPAPAVVGRVAIVFDDAGGSLAHVEEIIAIGRPVTVAVLPGLAHSSEVARRARAAGLEVLLHLPLEPLDGAKAMGPGGISVGMGDAEIRDAVRGALQTVPGAIGVNNHMGSRGTADRRVMRSVMDAVRERGLFFLDSRTTPDSVVETVAGEAGVRAVSRTLFLDNVDEDDAIRAELHRLIAIARERGEAIAIGHAQRRTPRVVAQMLGEFDRQGVAIVPVSALVR